MLKNRTKATLATVALILASVLGGAVPASAAMHANCYLNPGLPATDGVRMYATATVTCDKYWEPMAVTTGSKIQKQSLLVWSDATSWTYRNSAGTQTLSATTSFNCNGMGKANWRAVGFGRSSDQATTTKNSASKSLTC